MFKAGDITRSREIIGELLSHYVDGWDIFKKARDWDAPVHIKPESQKLNLPESLLGLAGGVIGIIAKEKYTLDTYRNSIEIITAEQMMDAYTTVGMPVSYKHWSFGKQFISTEKSYRKGQMGLAYEIVLNTDPCLVYCMEENSKTMQFLVIAHAGFGHNSFFKGNYMFREFTRADQVLDEREKMKNLVARYEEKYGEDAVEAVLDACHALQSYAVDRYKKPPHRNRQKIMEDNAAREDQRRLNVDHLMDRLVPSKQESKAAFKAASAKAGLVPDQQQDNILRFIAEYSPDAEPWQRELMLCACEQSQYFYPQKQTQVMNEGWASLWHYTLMNDLYDLGLIDEGMMMEFLQSHTNVLKQPMVGERGYSGFNPYALGFAIYQDIARICTEPTEEDRQWFPDFAGNCKPLETLKHAMKSYRDEGFIETYLSPRLIRELHLFAINDDDKKENLEISAIHDERGYRHVRAKLAAQYRLSEREPNIEAYTYDHRGDRSLTLKHTMHDRKPLGPTTAEVLKHVHFLWGKPVFLSSVDENGAVVKSFACPPTARPENPLLKPVFA